MDKAIDKLRKLLQAKQGEEALGNLEAAGKFAAKINELLIKYKLELSDVERGAEERENPFIFREVLPEEYGGREREVRVLETEGLADAVGRFNFCRVLCFEDSNRVVFVGREVDVTVAVTIFKRLAQLALTLVEVELAFTFERFVRYFDASLWNTRGGNASFRFSFFGGFTDTIAARLQEKRREYENNSTALVRADREVDEHLKKNYNVTEKPPEKVDLFIMEEAVSAGREFGRKAPLDLELNQNERLTIGD